MTVASVSESVARSQVVRVVSKERHGLRAEKLGASRSPQSTASKDGKLNGLSQTLSLLRSAVKARPAVLSPRRPPLLLTTDH